MQEGPAGENISAHTSAPNELPHEGGVVAPESLQHAHEAAVQQPDPRRSESEDGSAAPDAKRNNSHLGGNNDGASIQDLEDEEVDQLQGEDGEDGIEQGVGLGVQDNVLSAGNAGGNDNGEAGGEDAALNNGGDAMEDAAEANNMAGGQNAEEENGSDGGQAADGDDGENGGENADKNNGEHCRNCRVGSGGSDTDKCQSDYDGFDYEEVDSGLDDDYRLPKDDDEEDDTGADDVESEDEGPLRSAKQPATKKRRASGVRPRPLQKMPARISAKKASRPSRQSVKAGKQKATAIDLSEDEAGDEADGMTTPAVSRRWCNDKLRPVMLNFYGAYHSAPNAKARRAVAVRVVAKLNKVAEKERLTLPSGLEKVRNLSVHLSTILIHRSHRKYKTGSVMRKTGEVSLSMARALCGIQRLSMRMAASC